MRQLVPVALLMLAACLHVPASALRSFDLEREQSRLWAYFADRHAEIGDEYKTAELYPEARAHFEYAIGLVAEHRKARRGLGQKLVRGEWVDDDPMPDKSELSAEELEKARAKPDAIKAREYSRCADRARRQVEAAVRAEDTRAARILAHELLFYAPDDEQARELRGHVKDGEEWQPGFFKPWRDAGRNQIAQASEGELLEGEDEQARALEVEFTRRGSDYLIVRTSHTADRAAEVHRHGEASIKRAMELLEVSEAPFGTFKYTLTHLRNSSEYDAMLEKVLKLEGTQLEFARRMAGHSQREPWGYISRTGPIPADDMFGNTIAINVLGQAREGTDRSQPWISTGFGYLVTTQVLGTCITIRYRLIEAGRTGPTHEEMPEFTKKSGTPEHLRQAVLREVLHKRDLPLVDLVNVDTNEMVLEYAAKAFSLMEFFFAEHASAARKWLKEAPAPKEERIAILEKHFEMSVNELESAWREWVLANY